MRLAKTLRYIKDRFHLTSNFLFFWLVIALFCNRVVKFCSPSIYLDYKKRPYYDMRRSRVQLLGITSNSVTKNDFSSNRCILCYFLDEMLNVSIVYIFINQKGNTKPFWEINQWEYNCDDKLIVDFDMFWNLTLGKNYFLALLWWLLYFLLWTCIKKKIMS